MTLRRQHVTLADLDQLATGPDLSPRDLARATGYSISEDKVRRDIVRSRLDAAEMPCGTAHYYRIAFIAAQAYLRTLGKLPLPSAEIYPPQLQQPPQVT